MSRLGVLLLLVLGACRVEPDLPPPGDGASEVDSEAVGPEAGTPSVPNPPVAAGDTVRVRDETAGRLDADAPSRPVLGASGLVVPVVGVRPGDLVDTFNDARSEGRSHDAIDILAPRGTPVVAVADGEVARLFTSDKGGLTVYQTGPEGIGRWPVYYYAHLDAYAPGLAEGQRLRRGDPIGTVGDTGNAAPGNTHLHFAIWTVDDPADFWDGEPVNPYDLLVGR